MHVNTQIALRIQCYFLAMRLSDKNYKLPYISFLHVTL